MAADVRNFVADVYNTWGLIDIRSGQIIRALDHFRHAFQANPNMFEAWVNYGTINLSFRGYQDAHDAFQHAVQLRDNDYDAHIGYGVALRGLGQFPYAQHEYERAQQIDANRPDSYYNLGLLNESYMGGTVPDLQRAVGLLNQFIAKAGSTPRYADAVGRAQHHLRNLQLAINALNAAAALNAAPPAGGSAAPASGGWWRRRARVPRRQDQEMEALRQLSKRRPAVELHTEFPHLEPGSMVDGLRASSVDFAHRRSVK